MLTSLELASRYRRDKDNLLQAFYLPCLRQSQHYWRAAGYFSSGILQASTADLLDLASRGGTVRIVASPNLSEEDVAEIRAAYSRRDEVIARAIGRTIEQAENNADEEAALGILGFLISRSVLDIKIAVVDDGSGQLGLYHEKFGLFVDKAENFVAFSGSANESYNGLVSNFESINVFRSWVDVDHFRAAEHYEDFLTLWNDQTDYLRVLDFPTAAKHRLIQSYKRTRAAGDAVSVTISPLQTGYGIPEMPRTVTIRDYQKDAIRSWAGAGGRGILAMATGTGKTFTALALTTQIQQTLSSSGRPLAVVVTCPFTNLVDQWAREAEQFGIVPVKCYRSKGIWQPRAQQVVDALSRGSVSFGMFITTNDTLRSEAFQLLMNGLTMDTLFIADEVHNLGAQFNAAALPQHIKMRLGLSATPERWFDELGTSRLLDYFGEPVYRLTLSDAIRLKALTPYNYYPVLVHLNDEELHSYIELSEQIQRAGSISNDDNEALDDNPTLKMLLIKRARLLTGAQNKLDTLANQLRPFTQTTHNLIYCAEGYPGSDDDTPSEYRHIEQALKIVGIDLGMRADIFTSDTNHEDRERMLQRFASGNVQALLAMRCLDEGVDIPVARRAFILASSSNPRQFIQRRGRILRRAEHKDFAEIYDFVVVPPASQIEQHFSYERAILRGELRRVVEFANMAENGPVALGRLLDVRKEYNLLDVG